MTNSPAVFRAGTRTSALAQIQTGKALRQLESLLPGVTFDIVTTSSPGDRDRKTDLRVSPGDFFTQDLDNAVLSGELDCAVHSAKDLPDPVTDGLDWFWFPWREDPRDVLILRPGESRDSLPPAPRIGVSSDRREAWCREKFPNAKQLPIRGNIEDRLAQLDAGDFDVVVMAAAALFRLGLEGCITEWIPLSELQVPDGQGVLAMTFKNGDKRFTRIRSLLVKPVTFAGAGVGSADLCTQATIDALRHGDVCLHDTLMDEALLDELPASANCINVGKRAGAHTVLQENTTRMILDYARRGVRVVRLKGGDPCVFGRLAEEAEALDSLQLPYRVIPGISSLSVMGASTGILLTRRGVSNGFSVMSGRGKGGATSSVGIESRRQLPLVLFMSLSVLPDLLSQLRIDGISEDLPAAVVLEAGSPTENVLRGNVATIAEMLAECIEGAERMPAGLVVIGEVARFAFSREWGALQGQRVLLTCSEALQPEARRRVVDAGGLPVSLPLIRLSTEPAASAAVARLPDFDWLVVTSPSAVRCLLDDLRGEQVDVRRLPRILACGPGTMRELHAVGIMPDAMPESAFGAEGLLTVAREFIRPGERVMRVRSNVAGPALAEALRAHGAVVEDVCLYRNEALQQDALPPFDTIFFASSSAVTAFVDTWGIDVLADRTVLAIGKPTAKALATAGLSNILVGPEATVTSAIACLAADCVNRTIPLEE
jgi:uroporphyrinogen III methyltransferase/synthase